MTDPRSEGRAIAISPAGPIDAEVLEAGIQALERLDIPLLAPDTAWRPDLLARQGYLAGDDGLRAAQLLAGLDLEPAALWMTRGGYGCIRTLEALAGMPAARPTPLWGFSDGTALLAAWTRWGWPAWHGPPLSQLPRLDEPTLQRVRDAWHHNTVAPFEGLPTLSEGEATGPLAGGNLCVLASLVGTPHQAQLAGRVVVREDVGEAPYKVDRLTQQLLLGGGLQEAAALVLGQFTGVDEAAGAAIADFFQRLAPRLHIPVLRGLPVGHGAQNAPLPFGVATGHVARVHAAPEGGTLTVESAAT